MKLPTKELFEYSVTHRWYGLFHMPIVTVTHRLMEESGFVRLHTERFYIRVEYDFDLDCGIYSYWLIAPFVWLFYWYLTKRWIIERTLAFKFGFLKVEDGYHCKDWYGVEWKFWRTKRFQRYILKKNGL